MENEQQQKESVSEINCEKTPKILEQVSATHSDCDVIISNSEPSNDLEQNGGGKDDQTAQATSSSADCYPPSDDDLEEQQHFFDIFNTFLCYRSAMMRRIDSSCNFIATMSDKHQAKLAPYRAHLDRLRTAVDHNYELIKVIIDDVSTMFRNAVYMRGECGELIRKDERDLDTDRINSVLSQIVREWSAEGAAERATCFTPILAALDRHFPNESNSGAETRSEIRILVPGAGLGRLIYEIARRGFTCQGNEFSLAMLFVANFMLNRCRSPNRFTLYPWISHFCNNLKSENQIRAVSFPDVDPSAGIPPGVAFSMAAGSFPEIYADDRESWHCVASCFFLDTAANVLRYIETIATILRPGGLWINIGPLLYHFANAAEPSIEPPYDIVRQLILSYGFEMIEERTNVPAFYTRNARSMLCYQYNCVFFVARKVALDAS